MTVRSPRLRELTRATALAIVVASFWCVVYGRTSREAWQVPVNFSGDSLFTLASLKAARDGHLGPWRLVEVPELNAPFTANWNDFLRQHKIQYWLAGSLARWIGLFPASNVLFLLAPILAALSFFAVGRYFRVRSEWAFAGALAFAFSPFLFYRALSHLTLTHYWPIPLDILVVSWCFSRRGLAFGSPRFWVAASIAFVTGLHNIYYAGLLAQFLVLGSVTQLLSKRGRGAVLAPLALLGLLLASVIADNANMALYTSRYGTGLGKLMRPYGNLERYALKPIELLLPLGNYGLAPWRSFGGVYFRGALYRGEMGSPYLGLAGIAALLWLVVAAVRAALRRTRGKVPAAFLALAWILAYSVVGGLNGLLGAFGFVWFRATNRYSIWILALLLLWATARLSRRPWARHPGASLAAAVLAAALALADQLPPWTPKGEIRLIADVIASDATLGRSLEEALPAGAMLFQLPVVEYPEGPRILKTTDYEHLRPYLQSSRLRFSYGSDKGRAREGWQHRVEALEPEPMADALERIGFAGLLVNRKAYEDGGDGLRARLAAAGRATTLESPEFLFIRLRPSPNPVVPAVVVSPSTEPEDTAPSDVEAGAR